MNGNGLSVDSESFCMAGPECGNPAFSSRKRLWKICTLFFGNGSVTAFPFKGMLSVNGSVWYSCAVTDGNRRDDHKTL